VVLNFQYPECYTPILDNLYNPQIRYFDIPGGRDSSKSHSVAQTLIELSLEEKALFLCTREKQNSIKDSSYKLLKNKIEDHGLSKLFYITNDSITCIATGSRFIFKGMYRDSQAVRSTEGIKYCWVEEAQSLTLDSLKALIPTVRINGSKFFFTYNPLEDPDPVVEELSKKDPKKILTVKINYYHNPFISDDTKAEADFLKESDYEDWLHVYGGEPQSQGDTAILKRVEVNKAVDRDIEVEGAIEYGADIARYGDDRIVFFKRKGLKVLDFIVYRKKGIHETVDLLKEYVNHDKTVPIKIDDSGLGGGVTDYMKKDGYNAKPVNNGQRAKNVDKYPNAISEMWFNIREILKEMSIPNDRELIQELTRRRFRYDSKGRRMVESKDDYKKRYSSSPDKADAFLLCFYEPKTPKKGRRTYNIYD
jgi:phage terminase large subunit